MEVAFNRVRAEHALFRAISLEIALEQGRPHHWVSLLRELAHHARYEDETLYPYVVERVPSTREAAEHARQEHVWIEEELGKVAACVRESRPYKGEFFPALLHHFAEEERNILDVAVRAGVRETPEGTIGRAWELAQSLRTRSRTPRA